MRGKRGVWQVGHVATEVRRVGGEVSGGRGGWEAGRVGGGVSVGGEVG